MALAISFSSIVLPVFGGATIEGALSFSNRREHVDHARREVAGAARREVEFLVGEERGKVLESDAVAHELGRASVDFEDVGYAEVFSLDLGGRIVTSTTSPALRAWRLISCCEMNMSSGEAR